VGEVTALPARGAAEVAVGGKRLRVAPRELVALRGGERSSTAGPTLGTSSRPRLAKTEGGRPGGGVGLSVRTQAPAEVNLVGLTVDEALPRVDKLLDEATVAGRGQVRIIHGFGQGKLRKAVAELLSGHPQVASFRPGAAHEGGGGATVVELKE
jgi:DNA mismatch repair protein MutS2